MDFALSVMARVTEGQKAAAAAAKRRVAAEAAARNKALEQRRQLDRDRASREADKLIRRNVRPKKKITKRRDGPAPRKTKTRSMTPDEVALKIRGIPPAKPAGAPREKIRRSRGPPKPLEGMEFVERREVKKSIKIPHTSDYSDFFGSDYLVGIDLKCVKKMEEESTKASIESQKTRAEMEKKALKEKRMREAEELSRMTEEMKRRGVKTKLQNEFRLKATEREWVAVDVPTNALPSHEKAKLKASMSSSTRPAVSSASGSTASGRITKARKAEIDAAEIARKKALLRRSILAATGGAAPSPKRQRPRSPSISPERKPVTSVKRKRAEEPGRRLLDHRRSLDRRSHGSERRSFEDRRFERRSMDARVSKRPQYDDRGYNSEEWDDDDVDNEDDSDEDLFGIEALEREEARSSRLAALEDKRELKKEKQRRKEKEGRRREFERSHGGYSS